MAESAMVWSPDPTSLRGQGRGRRRRDPRRRARHRRRARRGRRDRRLHRPQQPHRRARAPTTTGPRPSRRPPSSSPRSAAPAIADRRSTTSTPPQVRRSPTGIRARPRPHRRARQRHLGRRGAQGRPGRVEHADLGARPRRRACASCGSRSTRTSSRRTTCCRCSSTGRAGCSSRSPTAPPTYNASHYRISVFYDLAKVAVNRLAFSQGHELAPHGATAVAVTPGWLRSEMMLEAFGVTEDELARRARRRDASRRRPTSRSRSRRATSAGPSPRSPPIPTGAAGTSSRSTSGELAARVRVHRRRRLAARRLAVHRGRGSARRRLGPARGRLRW